MKNKGKQHWFECALNQHARLERVVRDFEGDLGCGELSKRIEYERERLRIAREEERV